MYARALSYLCKATFSLCFVFSFLALPPDSKVFQYSHASETFSDELGNNDGLTQNKENAGTNDPVNGKEPNVCSFRLVRQGKTPVKLETAITRFQGEFSGKNGTTRSVTVDLIGAIHFAEKNYYAELNRIFQEYDVVVFEMVTQEGVDIDEILRKERNEEDKDGISILNIVPFTQQTLADILDFSYQIDGVDYSASNFKRGDATVEEFLEKLLSNIDVSEFCSSYLFSIFLDDSYGKTDGWILTLLCAKDKRLTAKRLLALELENSNEDDFVSVDTETTEIETPSEEKEDALVAFRNRKALKVVRQELEKGRTKIAIFYGAAHLPDFAQRLEKDFGMNQTPEIHWIPAWNMEKQ